MNTADVTMLRRMVGEPTTDNYTDLMLVEAIKRYPVEDVQGEAPVIDGELGTQPETWVRNPDWIPTYDLNAAAAEIWAEKAGRLAGNYDFQADGGSYSRSQAYRQAMQQARHYGSRRGVKTITQRPEPLAHGREDLDAE